MLIDRKEIEGFLNKYIAVGVPHDIIPHKLFFYYGRLENIVEDDIKLNLKNGFKIIPIDQIRDIHLVENNSYNEYYGGGNDKN